MAAITMRLAWLMPGQWSLIGGHMGSSRDLHCTFMPAAGAPEHYAGTISKFGVDIGYVQHAVIVWTVVAPTVDQW